jgi:HSP20 family protein
MALVSYDPWGTLSKLQDEVNRAFQSRIGGLEQSDNSSVATSNWIPAVDIEEQTERFVITADVPGVEPEQIEITMENGILTIKGERREQRNVEESGFRRVERVSGSFYRRFSLPDSADPERITAHGKNGVLEIVIPKGEKAKARRISVKS